MRRFLPLLALVGLLGWAAPASAVPMLQLDIAGGTYDPVTETIMADGSPFTLYAVLTPQPNTSAKDLAKLLSATYYVAVALVPQTSTQADLGSYSFNGTSYQVTGDMTYGVPPFELVPALQGQDPGDLPTHGVYPTFFNEMPFTFSSSQKAQTYDTSTNPGGLVPSASGGSYYVAFTIDTLPLSPDTALHFDLYDTDVRQCGTKMNKGANAACPDVDVNDFAPFSHDAQSIPPPPPLPEPTTVALFGTGLAAVVFRKKFAK
jgi:hypothetical protein